MNRRELLGVAGAMGAGMTLGGAHVFADGHGKAADDKMMAPLANHHLHFCGIHCAKKDPRVQIITQHYCGMIGKDMHQCLLYHGVGKEAKLLGVEYIVSDEIFRKLPDEEKKYWHPHTYEVLGGGLIAPSMKPADEMAFMKGLLLTWGKTWHTWPDPTTPVPMGEPMLMWSLTADGQHDARVVAARDKEFGVKTADVREARLEAIGYEVPAVPLPKDLDAIGRQWTATGEDKPTPRKK
jgi:hypothetical protein